MQGSSRFTSAPVACMHLWALRSLAHGCPGVLTHPPQPTMANARKEAEMVLFDSVRDVLRETNLHPRNVRPFFFPWTNRIDWRSSITSPRF